MATAVMTSVIRHIRRLVRPRDGGDLTDGQLLDRFLGQREEAAFEALVRRHGPMVLGVCRRVLHHTQDAEDAFQATFLVLIRKAACITPRELVGHWLYGVAYRTAMKARTMSARRQARERQVKDMPSRQNHDAQIWSDLQPLLDQELNRLPETYRVPVVLCDLEGKSRKDVARQLRLPEGTVSSRLARGRGMLGRRLAARGVALSAASLAVLLSPKTASASVPASLLVSTLEAATLFAAGKTAAAGLVSAKVVALTEGVLKAMLLTKLKIATGLLLAVGILGTGAGLVTHKALAEKPAKAAKGEAGPTVSGHVIAVDTGKNRITIASKGADKSKVENGYDLAKDVKVLLIDGLVKNQQTEGKLADLTEGTGVSLQLSADKKAVVRIDVRGPSLQASVKAVDPNQNTITVVTKDKETGGAGERTFSLAKEARITMDDGLSKDKNKDAAKTGKLTDLTEGTRVDVQLSAADKNTATHIRAMGSTINGRVTAVDLGSQSITINVKEDGNLVDKTFSLVKDAKIDGGTTGLNVGVPVHLRLSVFDKTKVVAVQVMEKGKEDGKPDEEAKPAKSKAQATEEKKPDLSGQISAVAEGGLSFTLTIGPKVKGDPPTNLEIKLTDKTKRSYFGVDAAGEQPTVGYVALVWLVEGSQETAASVKLGRKDADGGKKAPDLSGVITAVAGDAKTITVDIESKQKGAEATRADIKLTDKTKFSYFGVDSTAEIPTVGYVAQVWLVEGSKDTAAGIHLGLKK